MDSDALPQIERQIEVDADPDRVWEQIVEGELSREWLGVEVEPRRGGRVRAAHQDLIGTVEEVRPGRCIVWSWRRPDGDPSQVTIEVEPRGRGSVIRVQERLLRYQIIHAEPPLIDPGPPRPLSALSAA
ncbi:MAG TPA: SRPBCC domain-containing protein [Longimicrobiales bacterium]|nr:SRPBCC domain-containing protein [Longimicrobiales bacterium]